jgi:CRISPR system Cascade subunit CasC
MFVELHMLQNFAPSNLNRDDTNSPKDCTFGGYRRARISSQCLKRSIRREPAFLLELRDRVGTRTKLVHQRMVEHLVQLDHDEEEAQTRVQAYLEAMGFKWDSEKERTAVLLFVSDIELQRWAGVIHERFDSIKVAAEEPTEADATKPHKTAKQKKKEKAEAVDPDVLKELKATMKLKGTEAVDIALFGRMVAENTDMNIDAACQVAHAISTHEVQLEMDFYTAVDDLQPREDTGAGMMGIVEFNSACFYRYALIDVGQLARNLTGDRQIVTDAVVAFCRAAVAAIPTGKQNSFAAQNPPDWVRVVVRHGSAPRSLVNAFSKPVRPADADRDLVLASIERAEKYTSELAAMLDDPETPATRLSATASTRGRDGDLSLPEIWKRLDDTLGQEDAS